ncbi:MAG: MBL fold metallo-hydrolase [Chthoniobacter sp.]|nr:MBL fold metallo-hydrolase [Chthoniobacter sp.]
MQLDSFTGGIFDTNSFFLLNAGILIDAPQGVADWLQEKGYRVSTLLLTHGHIDHVWDAARIQKEHGCLVGYHADTEQMVTEPDFFKNYGYMWEIEPIEPGFHIEETDSVVIEGREFQVLLVPGHCPGSLCFLDKKAGVLFGGDVLFAGGVGRWDLPGGDGPLLFQGIKEKVFKLDDDITVLPGHGPPTKIGIERETNPYVGERSSFS